MVGPLKLERQLQKFEWLNEVIKFGNY
jgi:hypothetical protein